MLVLGGSWFVGRAVVVAAAGRGWRVSTFTRGLTTLPEGVVHVFGDREDPVDLARLAGQGPWDVVVDVSGAVPAVVAAAVRALCAVSQRYVMVSTVSVYRDWPHEPVSEGSPVWDGDPDADPGTRAWDPEAYGPLKVGCERAVLRVFGPDRSLVVRPHVVLGPQEYVGRLEWWLDRARRGGRVLVPGPNRSIQPIDVRDLAGFICDQVAEGATGVVNVAGPTGRDTYGDLVRACIVAVGQEALAPAQMLWVDEAWLAGRGVRQWTEIPLWRRAAAPWAMDTTAAESAGLVCRPLTVTVADTWAWLREGGVPVLHERHAEHGLAPERETTLLTQWDRRQAGQPTQG